MQTEIAAFRGAAGTQLSAFAASIEDQVRAEVIETAMRSDFAALEERLVREFRQKSSWRTAIAINLVAWLLSIAITFLIVVAGVPGWIIALVTKLKGG